MLFLVAWLFWPVRPPHVSLLSRMPDDLVAGVELRSASTLWTDARDDRLLQTLLHSPLGQTLQTAAKERGVALPDVEARAARIDQDLAQPFGLGLVARSLRGAVAIATADPQGTDFVLLANLDTLGWLTARTALLVSGESGTGDLPPHLKITHAGGATHWLALHQSLLVLASSQQRLASALQALKEKDGSSGLHGRTTFAAKGILLHLRPTPAWQRWLRTQTGGAGRFLGEGTVQITRDGHTVTIEKWGTLFPAAPEAAWQAIDEPRRTGTDLRETGQALVHPDRAALWCEGYVHPDWAWAAVSGKLWPGARRPRRGHNQPMSVITWEAIREGIITHADGTMLLALGPSPSLDEVDGRFGEALPENWRALGFAVPPAPEILTRWGVTHRTDAAQAFAQGMHRIVQFYRAPGGSVLYQQVRDITAITEANDTFATSHLRLHPLFWNYMTPGWRFQPSALESDPAGIGAFTTVGARLPQENKTEARGFGIRAKGTAQTLLHIRLGWSDDRKTIPALRTYLEDKAIDHGYLPPAHHAAFAEIMQILTALPPTVPQGDATVLLYRQTDTDELRYPFHVRATVRLSGE